jgi:hypothetical protein
MRDLFIYHPGTGTCVSLADPVYLVDAGQLCERDLAALDEGTLDKFAASVIGTRIDNHNMTNIFYPEGARNV